MRIRRSQVQTIVKVEGTQGADAVDQGTPIAANVRAYPLTARPIVVVKPTSPIWESVDPTTSRTWLDALIVDSKAAGAFVWLDPPAGHSGDAVEKELQQAGVPVRRKPRQATDAPIPEDRLRTPAEVDQSMREVVLELAEEAGAQLTPGDRQELTTILEAALAGAGL